MAFPSRSSAWIVAAVAASAGAAAAALALVRLAVPPAVLAQHNEVAGTYLQTLGTLYAVLLAFVVFVVWTQFDDARAAVEREANEITDLARLARALAGSGGDAIHGRLDAYVASVAGAEWEAMKHGQSSTECDRLLDEVWDAVSVIQPGSPRDEGLYGEALARFDNLSDARSHRLLCSRLRLPPAIWALLLMGAVLTVGSMALFGVPSLWPHALMTASLAGLICFVLYIVLDLDSPFWGVWQVTPDPIRAALRRPARTPDPRTGATGSP